MVPLLIVLDRVNYHGFLNFNFSDFTLIVDGTVPSINKKHTNDYRNITMISWDTYLTYTNETTGPWQIFDQSSRLGVDDGNFFVLFLF